MIQKNAYSTRFFQVKFARKLSFCLSESYGEDKPYSVDAPVNCLWSVELSSPWRMVLEEHGFNTREGSDGEDGFDSGAEDGFDTEGGSGENGDKVRTLHQNEFIRRMG